MADNPQTGNALDHLYIEHMAIEGDILFGTARMARPSNVVNYIWKIEFLTSDANSDFD